MALLEIDRISKTYLPPPLLLRLVIRSASKHPVPALRDVSLQVDAGEVVGLVGPNGAGKTSLIRLIATLLSQDSGRVTVDGFDTQGSPREVLRRLGLVLAEDRGLYWRLDGRHNLELFGILAGLRPREARRRTRELMELVGLAGRDKLVFGYSAGMRSRLTLARALLTRPPLLVLDEPTRSLDPLASQDVIAMLRQLAGEGHGILLVSHRLNEIDEVCDRVVVLVGGEVRYAGSPGDLRGEVEGTMHPIVALLLDEERAENGVPGS